MTEHSSPRLAAAYIRVSTDEQMELSPQTQLAKLQEYAQRENIIILQEHIYQDAGISGKKAEKRPEFMRMIAAAKEKSCPFRVLLVWKFSRFARNQEESIFYKSILRSKCGIDVISVSEPLLAGHFGSLIERIIEWMDEFYSIRLGEEVKRSMEVNARRGKLQASPAFGYRAEKGRLVVQPQEAEWVQWMFRAFVDGKGLFLIARELNAMGVLTHRGNSFENRTVEYILHNPVYIGKLRWNPSGKTRRDFSNESLIIADADHEPLISHELWTAAQQRLHEVKQQWGYKARPAGDLRHWLSGVVRCSTCGSTLIFTRPHYFKCSSYVRGRCPSSQHINADALSDALLAQLRRDCVTSLSPRYTLPHSATHDSRDISHLESALRELERKTARLQHAYLCGVISLEQFAEAKKELDFSASQLHGSLTQLQEQTDAQQPKLHTAVQDAWDTLVSPGSTPAQKNSAIRSILESCVFDKASSTLTITYRALL